MENAEKDNAGMKIPGNLSPKMPMRSDKDIYLGKPGCQDDGFFKSNGKPVKCSICGSRRFFKTVTQRLTEDDMPTFPYGLVGCAIGHDIHCICGGLAAREFYGVYERVV